MINSNVLSFRIRTRNATKKHRRQFCMMSIVFGGLPEIQCPWNNSSIFISIPFYTSICWCNPSSGWNYKILGLIFISNNIPRNACGVPLLGLSIYYVFSFFSIYNYLYVYDCHLSLSLVSSRKKAGNHKRKTTISVLAEGVNIINFKPS